MPKAAYKVFEALDPFFEVVTKGGKRYFDTLADDAIFESRYDFQVGL